MKWRVTVRMAVSRMVIVSEWQPHCPNGRTAIMAGRADNVAVWDSLMLSEWQVGLDARLHCQNGRWLSIWQLRMSLSITYVENESQYRILNLRMRHISIWEWEFSIWECDMYQSQNEIVSVSEWDCLSLRLRILKMRIQYRAGECDLIRPVIYCLIACPLDGSSRPYMKIGAQSIKPCTPNTSER